MKGHVLALVTLIAVATSSTLHSRNGHLLRKRRSLSSVPVIGSLFGGEKEPKIPHLGKYPLWKVHRYHGISLQPVAIPSDRVPSNLPISPNLSGEAPSIVNVPNPNYAPPDAIVAPPNQYSAPYPAAEPHSAPYPAAEPLSAPYPSADPPAPYPPAGVPSGPYPPAGVPSAPYPPPGVPSAPHPPVYNAQLHSSSGSSGNSASFAHSAATAHSAASANTAAEFAETSSQAGSEGSTGNFFDLQSMLPPELYQRLQQYTSTQQGRDKVGALFRIAANAQKLKTNAASTLQDVFSRFFGGAGGSANIALESGTYTDIPKVYPQHQGIFNGLKPVGTGVSGSPLPKLPDVPPLPEIPGLQKLPSAPGLPHINLPEISPLSTKGNSGQYVSFRFPQAPQAPASPAAYRAPAQSFAIPSTSYGTPVGPTFRPSPQSSGGDSSTFFQGPQSSYGSPVSESSGGSISTLFQRPESSYGLSSFDASPAASEIEEDFHPRHKPTDEALSYRKTTKLHRVPSSQLYNGESISESERQAENNEPFQPIEQKQTEGDYIEDNSQ